MFFFNKKIVLPTPICKINQLIRIDKKKASRLHFGLLFHSYNLVDWAIANAIWLSCSHWTRVMVRFSL